MVKIAGVKQLPLMENASISLKGPQSHWRPHLGLITVLHGTGRLIRPLTRFTLAMAMSKIPHITYRTSDLLPPPPFMFRNHLITLSLIYYFVFSDFYSFVPLLFLFELLDDLFFIIMNSSHKEINNATSGMEKVSLSPKDIEETNRFKKTSHDKKTAAPVSMSKLLSFGYVEEEKKSPNDDDTSSMASEQTSTIAPEDELE
ncbi:uncharacterized protein C7orf57 homolog isoform X3 [Misgurnus anguillicaudatus]|uniref:uncharacterized protein C7orf57 homolog isoform X3 n=1 Tax=Misgurnus anguillicaudatus TaxID=75329 RepID=UPI003CCF4425